MPDREPTWNPYRRTDTEDKKGDQDSWMMSYGDMMTLLLVFFVLIVSISEVDPVKMQQVTQSLRNAVSGAQENVPTLREIEEEMLQSVKDLNLEEVVQVNRDRNGVQLMMKGESFFPSGEAILYPKTYPFLDEVAWQITKTPYLVAVEGHTDNVPIHTPQFPSNWELSGARAAAVVRYMELKHGLPRTRFRIVGFADAKPFDPELGNSTPEARARNRRVIIRFLNEFAPGAKEQIGLK
ncbi:MAG TPA: flagellar motor protein MotS [Bacteroidetes bacterium]|nr:flagellar motor protein MotS [Bacteroidota bacterium]